MKTLNLIVPTCHQELTQSQLRYLYFLIASGYTDTAIKTMCLMRWAKADIYEEQPGTYLVKIDGSEGVRITDTQIAEVLPMMDWVLNLPVYPVCLHTIQTKPALFNATMDGLTFSSYMEIENLYQGYLHTKNTKLLDRICGILYGVEIGITPEEQYSVFAWFASLKKMLSNRYTHLFQSRPVNPDEQEDIAAVHDRLMKNMDTQIRSLTKGDITKEQAILQSEYSSALRELNAQAEDYEEIKKQTKS